MLKYGFATAAVACLLACGGGGSSSVAPPPPPPPPPPPNGVAVTNDLYTPASRSVAVGTSVTWVWNTCTGDVYTGQSCASHNVTFDDGVASPTQSDGTYSRTFAAAGTYTYHCTVHPSMTGTITVQ
ncbi:MAG TPA: plastocyanin/azurin family copper-binding protein [Gemmatimonadaceae bacterium]|jgi:plastocyanin|nr:plastocyanin/azurin family copper-binding protein [Gemmatimonadaceae bacterium]